MVLVDGITEATAGSGSGSACYTGEAATSSDGGSRVEFAVSVSCSANSGAGGFTQSVSLGSVGVLECLAGPQADGSGS